MKIENYREANPNDKFVARFDIFLEDEWSTVYHEWKLIRAKKGNLFISGPAYGVDDGMGGKKYFPFIEFTPEKKQNFEKKVMELLKDFMRPSPQM